jgi:hypothetical protein
MIFKILVGKELVLETLQNFISSYEEETGLESFVQEISNLPDAYQHFVALNERGEARAAMSCGVEGQNSYLQMYWSFVFKSDESSLAAKSLFSSWLENVKVQSYYINLPVTAPVIGELEKMGFKKQNFVLSSYKTSTEWYNIELPDVYRFVPYNRDLNEIIYDELIAPDLVVTSPIYVSKNNFIEMTHRLDENAFESWVMVIDEESQDVVGVCGSMLSIEKGVIKPVIYGPHCRDTELYGPLLSEMLSFWKSKEKDEVKILRVEPFNSEIIEMFKLVTDTSVVSFLYEKEVFEENSNLDNHNRIN